MLRMRLTKTARAFLAALVVGATGLTLYTNPKLIGKVAPAATATRSNVPPVATLPGERAAGAFPVVAAGAPGCANLPEVRSYLIDVTGALQVSSDSSAIATSPHFMSTAPALETLPRVRKRTLSPFLIMPARAA